MEDVLTYELTGECPAGGSYTFTQAMFEDVLRCAVNDTSTMLPSDGESYSLKAYIFTSALQGVTVNGGYKSSVEVGFIEVIKN